MRAARCGLLSRTVWRESTGAAHGRQCRITDHERIINVPGRCPVATLVGRRTTHVRDRIPETTIIWYDEKPSDLELMLLIAGGIHSNSDHVHAQHSRVN